jgi:hypothetical protein
MIRLGDPFREHGEGLFEDPELLITRGDVSVTELGMQNQFLLGPPEIERLVCFVSLVGEQGIFFLCVNKRGIAVEGSFRLRTVLLDGGDKVPVDPDQSLYVPVLRRDECLALLALLLLERIMEGFKIPEYGGRGRNGAMLFLPPASFLRPSLLTGESLRFYPTEHAAKAFIFFEDPDVVNGVSSREVEQYQGEDHLLIRPPLGLPHVHMGADVISQTQDRDEVEVHGKAGKGGHARIGFLFFILVGQDALWHNGFTSLVMELVS